MRTPKLDMAQNCVFYFSSKYSGKRHPPLCLCHFPFTLGIKLCEYQLYLRILKPCISYWDLNPCPRTRTQPKPRLGLEPMRPGLKPGQNPDWDLNPRAQDSKPAKTHSLPTEITHVVSGLMKLRFLMCHRRKNSVWDKVIGKKWIYLERKTLHRQSVGHPRRRERPWEKHTPQTECGPSQKVRKAPGYGVVSFYRGG